MNSNQSLIVPLLPMLEEMKDAMRNATVALESVPSWDGSEYNHEDVLQSIAETRQMAQEWQKSLVNRLQALWMVQAREYNNYKKEMERCLRQRHIAELECAFPSLRSTATSAEAAISVAIDDHEIECIKHMLRLGFRYDREVDGTSKKLSQLCARQLKEQNLFVSTTMQHSESLLDAKRRDVGRLREMVGKVVESSELVTRQVEQKIAASQRMTPQLVYRRQQQGSARQVNSSVKDSDIKPPSEQQ